jgi:hypothetical protein
MDSSRLAQDRDKWKALMDTTMKLQVPLDGGNFFTIRTISFSSRTVLQEVSQLFKITTL